MLEHNTNGIFLSCILRNYLFTNIRPWLFHPGLGSGGGWNSTLSPAHNFTAAIERLIDRLPSQPAGYAGEMGWLGGLRCREGSYQFGGFGGGGGGCRGGGGGGGFRAAIIADRRSATDNMVYRYEMY